MRHSNKYFPTTKLTLRLNSGLRTRRVRIFILLNFVLFVALVVICLCILWLRLCRAGLSSCAQSGRVALTPPAFLNLRECALQSQPHALQYHSVKPSHSSRSARTAWPLSTARWSDGMIRPCRTGTTLAEPHSGQSGVFLVDVFFLAAFFRVTGTRFVRSV